MQVSRRHFSLATAGGLSTLALAACSQDESASSAPSQTSASGEPVSIEHANGTATFETTPTRIFAFSSQWIDALLALGVTPVGYIGTSSGGDERELYPWESSMPADAQQIPASVEGTVPFEQIAALTPDLILGDWSVSADPSAYARLEELAPTIVVLGQAQVDTWEDQLAAIGTILGREDDAQAVVDETHAAIDAVAAQHPGLQGKTFALAQYIFSSQQLVIVADPEDGASQLFSRLGMQLPEQLVTAAAGQGRAMLSPEQIDLLSADLVVFLPNGGEADLAAIPGWTDLPSVRSGGMVHVDFATVVGFNTPSALSVQAVLTTIEAGLTAAEGA